MFLMFNYSRSLASYDIKFEYYKDETQLLRIKSLMDLDLSEPYSVFTYRYFINNWPNHCILAKKDDLIIGAIISKVDLHGQRKRGYIAMLAVDRSHRKGGIGSQLVLRAIEEMKKRKKHKKLYLKLKHIILGL